MKKKDQTQLKGFITAKRTLTSLQVRNYRAMSVVQRFDYPPVPSTCQDIFEQELIVNSKESNAYCDQGCEGT